MKIIKILPSIFITSFLLFSSADMVAKDYSIQKCQVLELEFDNGKKAENPFEVHFGAIISYESGMTLDVPGFYNDNNWVIRYCPE